MNREKKAGELFLEGRNCAQAVFAAFCDATGYSESDALKLASAFGGGIYIYSNFSDRKYTIA